MRSHLFFYFPCTWKFELLCYLWARGGPTEAAPAFRVRPAPLADATGELARQRYDLVVGAPQPQADLDRVSGIVEADEDATDEVLAELKAGPASAVLNVETLYNLGLARGLKGGLAKVAIEEPPALMLERR